jgi:hypothetical protein
MKNKELDLLVEQYFGTNTPLQSLSLTTLVEMIEEITEDRGDDLTARADPAGFDRQVNPEMIAKQVPRGKELHRPTVERVVAQMMGNQDDEMVDAVMLHFSNPQGLGDPTGPQTAVGGGAHGINNALEESRLPPDQWKEIYRQLLVLGVDSDMVAAIKLLADSGIEEEDLRAMLNQQSMQDARSMQQMNEKKKGGRFSYKIDIPALVPSEAWGDPSHQSRKDIEQVFSVISTKHSMQERIAHVNEFIDPASAAKKAPGGNFHAVIRMMQIIEALQATLNDYSESSAGFVFEGFMAALTGGNQVADRIGGTLPIEDFAGVNKEQVSLKLLSPSTGIHGSFTNLLDYLYLRGGGQESIKYLIAYKDSDGDDVSRLKIYDFIIDQNNFVEVMKGAGEFEKKFGASAQPLKVETEPGKFITLKALPDLLSNFDGSDDWRREAKMVLTHGTETSDAKGKKKFKPHVPGYTKAGMFHNAGILGDTGAISDTAKLDADAAASKDRLSKDKKGASRRITKGDMNYTHRALAAGKQAADAHMDVEEAWAAFQAANNSMLADLMPAVENPKDEAEVAKAQQKQAKDARKVANHFRSAYGKALNEGSWFGSFHETEKIFLTEQQLLSEGGRGSEDASSQWAITGGQMIKLTNVMNVTDYGELNMSAENINACADIYIEKMNKDMITLLETTKKFTTNVGKYFSTEKGRNDYADAAIDNAKVVVKVLEEESSDEDI